MSSTHLRQSVLAKARSVVVKVGTHVLTNASGKLDVRYLGRLSRQIAALHERGMQVTLVSSGAVGAGCADLDLSKRPTDVASLQAVAAVGQPRLMVHMHDALAKHGLKCAQLLLTREDFDVRARFLNIRNCVTHLQSLGCVPIINENDTVAVDEITFGDNDLLAALMCNALPADALVMLTTVDGLLDDVGSRIDLVDDVSVAMSHARPVITALGSGGMRTKLEAAKLVTDAGEIAVIANGRDRDVLPRLFDAAMLGTVFVPASRKLDSRNRWIGLTTRPAGTITVDAGAAGAVRRHGKSLLAIGVTPVTGRFDRGQVVLVKDSAGETIARGLTNYAADELKQIQGQRSNQIAKTLGRPAYAEVVHRDNLVVRG